MTEDLERPTSIFFLLMAFVLSYYLAVDLGYMSPFWRDGRTGSGASIGKIKLIDQVGGVQHREKENLYWLDARVDKELQYHDSVLTLDNAHAQIEFLDGTTINVDPNTLIVLEPQVQEAEASGAISLVVKRGNLQVVKSGVKKPVVLNKPAVVKYVPKKVPPPAVIAFVEETPLIELPKVIEKPKPIKIVKKMARPRIVPKRKLADAPNVPSLTVFTED